ncbi:NlpC/P60 family protein [Bifidobacterium eulemuris]|nr:NlpC/P60 family protein [Bifidobacterium eulemuris]QOL31869.1 C40 family peptidase [Bifidobacterium eulemuris]
MKASAISSSVVACVAAGFLFACAPTAVAAEDTVTSTRSFPSVTLVRKDLTVESTSTQVEEDSDWGSIESLDVPQTQSQAEKEAEEQQAEAEAAAEATDQAAEQEAAQSQAASRNNSRDTLSSSSWTDAGSSSSSGAAAAVDRAYSLIGSNMDCTELVTAALAARGISFHGWPEDYLNVPGGSVVTDGSLQVGDILIYAYTGGWNGGAHYDHVALYVGNGQAIHGGWNGSTVALAGAMTDQLTAVVRIP